LTSIQVAPVPQLRVVVFAIWLASEGLRLPDCAFQHGGSSAAVRWAIADILREISNLSARNRDPPLPTKSTIPLPGGPLTHSRACSPLREALIPML